MPSRFFRHPLDIEQPCFRFFWCVQALLNLTGELINRRYLVEPRGRQRNVTHTGKFLFFSAFCRQKNAAAQNKRVAGADAVRPRYALNRLLHTKNFRSARQQNIPCQRCHIERFSCRFCVHLCLPPFSKPYTHFPFRNRYRKMTELMLQVSGYAQKITRISGIRRTVTVM